MKPENYLYAIKDSVDLQNTVKEWYERRYGVVIDPYNRIDFITWISGWLSTSSFNSSR